VLHPIRRICMLNRSNLVEVRQIESAVSPRLLSLRAIGHTGIRMSKPDPLLDQISAQFTQYNVERSSGGSYIILDRRTSDPLARLRPIPDTDRFELFYWSNVKGRWTTFGNMGRMKLMLESAHEIVENDPMFRVPRRR
jgi:hypothetical protein